jgi:carboxyl-terminal processing protease
VITLEAKGPLMLTSPKHLPALVLTLVLAACGGGGSDSGTSGPPAPSASCSVAEQKTWLADYSNEWYFWYRLSPRPNATTYDTAAAYFDALLYTGTDTAFPKDRWSRSESTESFNRFFGDGASLGWGVSVAGLEVTGQPSQPLLVRYIEAASPAAQQDVRRGDQVLAINGRLAADVIAADDFSALSANAAGDVLTLRLQRAGVERTVSLTAAVFTLTPVPTSTVVTSPFGKRTGYLVVKDMVSQALAPMDAAFARFKADGVTELVLDLRYNGGGLVSTGGTLASYIAGLRGNARNYATLLYNDKRAATNNQSYAFSNPAASLGLPRVFVLMGRRTCSASEQVINGLRGAGVDVVAVGETTCGKPVGFLPASNCSRTYSMVNFESVNARNEGRYFNGLDATCPAREDFTQPLGSANEPLLGAALDYADNGFCVGRAARPGSVQPLGAARGAGEASAWGARARTAPGQGDGEERFDMLGR